ncbi:MAG TPA: formyltetrahydrofolate deformylase [Caulobacteraceae bacterium]|nr:formyltetrahydrofolate deformylase [Caulobacteraceae bacterium]
MSAAEPASFVLNLSCPDRMGVVAAVSGFLAASDANITEISQFNDPVQGAFFMRAAFSPAGPAFPPIARMEAGFAEIARGFDMRWKLTDAARKARLLIAVSRFGHCLFDLLHRWRAGLLAVEIAGVVSNHDDMRSFVEWNGLAYFHLPVTRETRPAQEARILELVEANGVDLVVLARYMQVLSPELCERLAGRCINIHHAFLPGFKGARPYHQAHARGVKIIGATAHYVTSDLDEGPIIEQAVERVDHSRSPAALVEIGRDIECAVLSRAVRWHVENRIMMSGKRTVVFP